MKILNFKSEKKFFWARIFFYGLPKKVYSQCDGKLDSSIWINGFPIIIVNFIIIVI
jgi:hypothetical protein